MYAFEQLLRFIKVSAILAEELVHGGQVNAGIIDGAEVANSCMSEFNGNMEMWASL